MTGSEINIQFFLLTSLNLASRAPHKHSVSCTINPTEIFTFSPHSTQHQLQNLEILSQNSSLTCEVSSLPLGTDFHQTCITFHAVDVSHCNCYESPAGKKSKAFGHLILNFFFFFFT